MTSRRLTAAEERCLMHMRRQHKFGRCDYLRGSRRRRYAPGRVPTRTAEGLVEHGLAGRATIRHGLTVFWLTAAGWQLGESFFRGEDL